MLSLVFLFCLRALRPSLTAMPPVDLGRFEIGQIWALHKEGFSHRQIAERVTHGRTQELVSLSAVGAAVRRLDCDPSWMGDRAAGSGRKRKTTEAEDKAIVRAAKRHRGTRKVNSTTLQKLAPTARAVCKRTVRRRLHESGLRYLRRRTKTIIPAKSVAARLEWAAWTLKQKHAYLRRWVYTDGVSFYLSRDEQENGNAQRAALGLHVWREAASKDALYKDCLGPSTYTKAQGSVVRMWGLLCRGNLRVRILAHGETMNRFVYARIIKNDFARWLRRAHRPIIVQDYERSLRCREPLEAFKDVGITVSHMHPKHSPDLNAIENVWKLLRERLDETLPANVEGRAAFVARLRSAVCWLNRNRRRAMLQLAGNMKVRARDVQDNSGFRTKW